MTKWTRCNFAALQHQVPLRLHLGMLAEKYFADDPNTGLLKLRQLTELLAALTGQYRLKQRLFLVNAIRPKMAYFTQHERFDESSCSGRYF
ncbi:MAG: hypothetical protein CTY19_11665 [Methylomonas sp.]|nr:MAG: hypothetical protein CTY19_11665 [Methylomonas sp.]